MFKKLLAVFALTLSSTSLIADNHLLDADHPDQYVVQPGDTLWDIADQFLKDPWLWPEVWQANPQVDNPHRIYPGDIISLVYLGDDPKLSLKRQGRPTVKLSPHGRREPIDSAIPAIPLNAIEQFLTRPRVLNEATIEAMPYVLSMEDEEVLGAAGKNIYVMSLDGFKKGDHVSILRTGHVYKEVPNRYPFAGERPRKPVAKEWNVDRHMTLEGGIADMWNAIQWSYNKDTVTLGHELIEIAQGVVIKTGSPAVVAVTQSSAEISKGDLVTKPDTKAHPLNFFPKAAESIPSNTRVLAVNDAVYGVGKFQIFSFNKGGNNGISPGDVLASYRPGIVVRDDQKYARNDLRTLGQPGKAKVLLPDELVGYAMVFRTFDHVSYAIVMRGDKPIKIHDILRSPNSL